MRYARLALLVLLSLLVSAVAVARNPEAAGADKAIETPGDPLLDQLTELLRGVYSDGVRTARFFDLPVEGAPRMLLGEISMAEDGRVEAHVLAQFIRRRGEPYLRMMRFPAGQAIAPGLWAKSDLAPDFSPNQLDILADLSLQLDSRVAPSRFRGTTDTPIPTYTGDAIELKSEIAADSEQLFIFETGFTEGGDIVWTFPEAGRSRSFKRVEEPTQIDRRDNDLIVVTLKPGEEDAYVGQPGDQYEIHYTGYLTNGQVFDSSRRPGRSALKQAIPGQLNQGWNLGIPGSKVGELRRLIIPPSLGYGARGYPGVIPPDAWLVFDVEIVDIQPKDRDGEERDPENDD